MLRLGRLKIHFILKEVRTTKSKGGLRQMITLFERILNQSPRGSPKQADQGEFQANWRAFQWGER